MKNKKFRIIFTSAMIVVLAILITLTAICCHNFSHDDPNDDKVTITFEVGDGTPVSPIEIDKGSTVSTLPQTSLEGKIFNGWYFDEYFKKPFDNTIAIENDITLYAYFAEQLADLMFNESNEFYEEQCKSDKTITIIGERGLSKEQFLKKIQIEGVTGEVPEFEVQINGNEYTLIPGTLEDDVTGYEEGKIYSISIPRTYRFKDLKSNITNYKFRIKKDRTEEVEVNPNIKNILKTEIIKGEYSTEVENGYEFLVLEVSIKKYKLQVGDIVSIDDTLEFNPDTSTVVRITNISQLGTYYLIEALSASMNEIFPVLDISFTEIVDPNTIIADLDSEEMEKQVMEGDGLKKVTKLLAASLTTSPTVRKSLGYAPSFTTNVYPHEDTMKGIEAELFDGVTAKVEIGTGHNPNFDSAYTDKFIVVRFTIEYNATIKRKVSIKAKLEITQYLAISMQGYSDYSLKAKNSYLRFEYAFNLYSQTDLDLTVLICSVNEGDVIDEENGYKDISEEISNLLSKDENESETGDNLISQLKEFMENESGDIELFRAPLIRLKYPVIPIIHVLDVNTNLDFVVKVNFAAGINIDASILEAVQIGASGDTTTGNIKSIRNNLPGGDQYSLELSACGYIGVKMGFEASLTISFCGASKFGEVGIAVFIGPYVDMYGFVKMSLSRVGRNPDAPKQVNAEVLGGYYIEIGINVGVELIARSSFFKVKVGAELLDEKIPLVNFGFRDVLVNVIDQEEKTIYLNDSTGEDTFAIDYKNFVGAKGEYIDITNGNEFEKDIPWDNFYIKFDNACFSYNSQTGKIYYDRTMNNGQNTDECIMTYYYKGAYLRFNSNSINTLTRCPAGTVKLIWTDTNVVPIEAVGKTFEAKVEFYVDDVLVEERTQPVRAGTKLGYIASNYTSIGFVDGKWDLDPVTTTIIEDTTLSYHTKAKQFYVSFAWFDEALNKWKIEVRAVKLGETPTAPNITIDGEKAHFTYWEATKGFNNSYQNISNRGLSPLPDADDLWKWQITNMMTSGYEVDEAVKACEGDTYWEAFEKYFDMETSYNTSLYYATMHHYVAHYEYDDCIATIVLPNGEVHEDNVPYNSRLDYSSVYRNVPNDQYVVGYSFNEDLSDVKSPLEMPVLNEDVTIYVIHAYKEFKLTFNYYNDLTDTYEVYKEVTYTGEVDFQKLLNETNEALVKEEGVIYELDHWIYETNGSYIYYNTNNRVNKDLNLSPLYKRTFDIQYDTNGGKIISENQNKTVTLSSDHEDGPYYIFIDRLCEKEDNYYNYEFQGWKDVNTGKVYQMWQSLTNEIVSPTTLEAIWKPVEKEYDISVYTPYGQLLNGKQEDRYTGGYDGYIEFYNKYKDYTMEPVRLEQEHETASMSQVVIRKLNNSSYDNDIIYVWTEAKDKHQLTIDANGGKFVEDYMQNWTLDYGATLQLQLIVLYKDTDATGEYTRLEFVDVETNEKYTPYEDYVITKDTTLKMIWNVNYFNYNVTYYLNGNEIKKEIYHYNDPIIELSRPEDTMKYHFSGWKWYDGEQLLTSKPELMPSKNLVVKATTSEVHLKYVVDGKEISNEVVDANSLITIKEKYVKEGYNVSDWSCNIVTVNNNQFTMPEEDVIFVATTTKATYSVTYQDLDGEVIGDEETYEFGTIVTLKNVPSTSVDYYEWVSDDVKFNDNVFTMPANNVIIRLSLPLVQKHLIYVINNEIVGYEYVSPGKKFELKNNSTFNAYDGIFSGWYSPDVEILDNSIVVKNNDVYVYGYYTSGNVTVNVYLDNTNEPAFILHTTAGTIITTNDINQGSLDDGVMVNALTIKLINQKIQGWLVNDSQEINNSYLVKDQITEVSIKAVYDNSRKVSYNILYNPGIYEYNEELYYDRYYNKGEKVYLLDLPVILETQVNYFHVIDWYSVEGIEILTDENGEKYFIMPDYDVTLNTCYREKILEENGGYIASVYILSPMTNEEVYYDQYQVYTNNPVYFTYPEIEGYSFVCWRDSDGNEYDEYNGVELDMMGGNNKKFVGIYEKKTKQIATFRIDGEVYCYQVFDSYKRAIVPMPNVKLQDNKLISCWFNDNTQINYSLYLYDEKLIGVDLIFDAITYDTQCSMNLNISFGEEEFELINIDESGVSYSENTKFVINNSYFDKKYQVKLVLNYYVDMECMELDLTTLFVKVNGDIVEITIPTSSELSSEYNINFDENSYFSIKMGLEQ